MRLWRRVWAIEVGGVRHEGLRIAFRARQPSGGCDVQVYNPPRSMVAKLYDGTTPVRVLAGYAEAEGAVEVAQGNPVRGTVSDQRSSADPVVSFHIAEANAPFRVAAIANSWDKTTAIEVITYVRQQMGIPADVIELPTNVKYCRGYVVEGPPGLILDEVVRDAGAQWTIRNGRLRVWPIGGQARNTAVVLTPATGLLDLVAPVGADQEEVQARTLMRPAIQPGDVVQIRAPWWTGTVKVQEVEHRGDTSSQSWQTSIIGRQG